MAEASERACGPPEPPSTRARVRLRRQQAIGLALLAVAPVAALAGALDEHEHRSTRTIGPLEAHVTHVDRVRQNRTGRVIVELANHGEGPVRAEVAISPEYLEGADEVRMAPPPERMWATRLGDIAPGQRARVAIEYEAESPGWYEGALRIRALGPLEGESHEARVPLSTLVFF